MILFDTSAIIDAIDKNSPFHGWSVEQLAMAAEAEGAGVNAIAIAETSVNALDRDRIPARLEAMGLTLLDLPVSAATRAAKAYAIYLARRKSDGTEPKSKLPLPDFFIGAHAEAAGMSLVTRDPNRVKKYFPAVKLITP